jgi:alcohol dehydrogenase, propanol-preferring
MRAMVLDAAGTALRRADVSDPEPASGQVLLRVRACGVCRTDLHIVDGELDRPKLPLVLGHQIVGEVVAGGTRFATGERVGVPWLAWTCGECRFCVAGHENLCDRARFTGYDIDGGFAGLTVADERYCLPLPDGYPDEQAAPLLCAGLIGYRALRLASDAERIGLYGFGASAHIICQVAVAQGRRVFAGTRAKDEEAQELARSLGAEWAGDAHGGPPEELDAVIVFAPVGELVPAALGHVRKGGSVVCAGIHMSDIPSFPYEFL